MFRITAEFRDREAYGLAMTDLNDIAAPDTSVLEVESATTSTIDSKVTATIRFTDSYVFTQFCEYLGSEGDHLFSY